MNFITKAFLEQSPSVQQKAWQHIGEWVDKVYEPLSMKRTTELQSLGEGNVSWKIKELLLAIKDKDIEKMQRIHSTLPSVWVQAGVLGEQRALVLGKRAFVGFNNTFAWTLAITGHLLGPDLAAGQAVGVLNHYILSHPSTVSPQNIDACLKGEGGYWPKVKEYSAGASNNTDLWQMYSASREHKINVALEHYGSVCEKLGYAYVFESAWDWLSLHCDLLNPKVVDAASRKRLTGNYYNPTVWGIALARHYDRYSFTKEEGIDQILFDTSLKPQLISFIEKEMLRGCTKSDRPSVSAKSSSAELPIEDTEDGVRVVQEVSIKKVRFL